TMCAGSPGSTTSWPAAGNFPFAAASPANARRAIATPTPPARIPGSIPLRSALQGIGPDARRDYALRSMGHDLPALAITRLRAAWDKEVGPSVRRALAAIAVATVFGGAHLARVGT